MQELARLLQKRGEPVLAIHISWISRQWVFFTDEAWFHLSGYVNSQNYQTWRTENPHNYTETPLHPRKIGVWCAVSRRWIIGPLFFEASINAEAYQELIQQFIALLQVDEHNLVPARLCNCSYCCLYEGWLISEVSYREVSLVVGRTKRLRMRSVVDTV